MHKREGNTDGVQSSRSNAVQTQSPVTVSVGVQVCPSFTPPLDSAAKTASTSQRDKKINAQRGMRRGAERLVDGQNGENGATSSYMDVVMTG